MIFIRDDIPRRLLTKHALLDDNEDLFVELYFRNVKRLLFGTYHLPSESDIYNFNNLDKALDLYSHYDKKLLVAAFNARYKILFQVLSFTNVTLKTLSKVKLVSKMQIILAPLTFFRLIAL